MLWTTLAAILALTIGTFAGMRLELAHRRFRELRRGLAQVRNENSLGSAFASTLRQRSAFEAAGQVHHARVSNVIQFELTWNWDLSILLDLLRSTPEAWSLETGWRRKLLARTLALVVYEMLKKLDRMLDPAKGGRKTSLWRPIRALSVEPEVSSYLLVMHADIATVLTAHGALLDGVHSNIIAHRDADVAAQLLWMRKADAGEIEALGWELLALPTKILSALGGVITAISAKHPASQPVKQAA